MFGKDLYIVPRVMKSLTVYDLGAFFLGPTLPMA